MSIERLFLGRKKGFLKKKRQVLLFNGVGRLLEEVVVLAAAVGLGARVALVAVPLTVGLAGVRVNDVVGFGLTSPLVAATDRISL